MLRIYLFSTGTSTIYYPYYIKRESCGFPYTMKLETTLASKLFNLQTMFLCARLCLYFSRALLAPAHLNYLRLVATVSTATSLSVTLSVSCTISCSYTQVTLLLFNVRVRVRLLSVLFLMYTFFDYLRKQIRFVHHMFVKMHQCEFECKIRRICGYNSA